MKKKERSSRQEMDMHNSSTKQGQSTQDVTQDIIAHNHRSTTTVASTRSTNAGKRIPLPPPPPLDEPKRYNNHSNKRMDESSKTHSSVRRSRSKGSGSKSRSPTRANSNSKTQMGTMKDGSAMQDASDLTTATTGSLSCSTANHHNNNNNNNDNSHDLLDGGDSLQDILEASAAAEVAAVFSSSSSSLMKDMSGRMSSQLRADRVSRKDRRKKCVSHDGTVSNALRRTGSGNVVPRIRRTTTHVQESSSSGGGDHKISIDGGAVADIRRTKSDAGGVPIRKLRSSSGAVAVSRPSRRPERSPNRGGMMDESSKRLQDSSRKGCTRTEEQDDSGNNSSGSLSMKDGSRKTPKGRLVPPPPPPPTYSPENNTASRPKVVMIVTHSSPQKNLHFTNDLL